MKIRYSYRLRVSAANERALLREWSLCRFVWNECVAEGNAMADARLAAALAGATELPAMSGKHAGAMVTMLRQSHAWLAAGSSVPQRQTLRDYLAARKAAFAAGRGHPRFRKRGTALPTMNYTTNGFTIGIHGGQDRLYVAGGIVVRPVWSRPLPSAPSSVRITRDSVGRWHASFVVDIADVPVHSEAPTRAVGVDWGVGTPATTVSVDLTTGVVDDGPRFDLAPRGYDRRNQAEVAARQRQMARRAKRDARGRLLPDQSAGYRKAKHLAARARAKAKAQRRHDARTWAARVVAEHDVIAVEDFRSAFLAKSTMARAAADNAVAQMKTARVWAATRRGIPVHLVHPAFTTMDCSSCGARATHRIPLDQRMYACTRCGMRMDRDKNAATNVVARAGLTPVGADDRSRGRTHALLAV